MKTEKPQSIESQIQLARPRRAEVKRVPLTPEEKEFLGEIMKKAVAAEKAGKLAEALGLYTDYKNELSKIKERREKEQSIDKEWTREDVIEWAEKDAMITNAEKWVNNTFKFDEPPKITTKKDLILNPGRNYNTLPNKIHVKGSMFIGSDIKRMPHTLIIDGNLEINSINIYSLPSKLCIEGDLFLKDVTVDKKAFEKIFVRGDVNLEEIYGGEKELLELLIKLQKQGKIKGGINLIK